VSLDFNIRRIIRRADQPFRFNIRTVLSLSDDRVTLIWNRTQPIRCTPGFNIRGELRPTDHPISLNIRIMVRLSDDLVISILMKWLAYPSVSQFQYSDNRLPSRLTVRFNIIWSWNSLSGYADKHPFNITLYENLNYGYIMHCPAIRPTVAV
jgi:hypothetical protein